MNKQFPQNQHWFYNNNWKVYGKSLLNLKKKKKIQAERHVPTLKIYEMNSSNFVANFYENYLKFLIAKN